MFRYSRFTSSLIAGASVTALMQLTHAQAQVAADTPEEDTLAELIVVTAQRRVQTLADVPASISVISDEDIDRYQIRTLEDYTALTPNIGFSSLGTPTELFLSFRGVSTLGGAVNANAVYVDDFNITPSNVTRTLDANLLDVERIEVLRGPQGTSFGRNVLGGGISIVTKKPSQEYEAKLVAEYSSFNTVNLQGVGNIPLTDTLAVRFSGYYNRTDGFIENINPAGGDSGQENFGGRLAARFTPNEQLTIDVAASYSDYSQGFPDAIPDGNLPEFFYGLGESFSGGTNVNLFLDPLGDYAEIGFFPENFEFINADLPQERNGETFVFNGSLSYDFGPVTGIINGGYIDNSLTVTGDGDYTSGSFFFDDNREDLDSFSIEARLVSNSEGPFNWVAGALYANDDSTSDELRVFGVDFLTLFLGFPPEEAGEVPVDNQLSVNGVESFGIYADGTYELGRWTVAGGLRYSRDNISESIDGRAILNFDTGEFVTPGFVGTTITTNTVTGKASVIYEVNDTSNAYVTVARGSRPGGSNLGVLTLPDAPVTYDPEFAWNYELGFKGEFLGVTFNLAAFYTDWTDLQIATLRVLGPDTAETAFVTANVGSASAYGLEFDFAAEPIEGLTITGGLGLIDATFGDEVDPLPDDFGRLVEIAGNRLPTTSEVTANFAAQYTFPVYQDYNGFIRGEFSYRGNYFSFPRTEQVYTPFNPDLTPPPVTNKIPGVETVNIRAGIQSENLSFVFFAENLTNKVTLLGPRPGSDTSGFAGTGLGFLRRNFGARITYTY